MDHIHLLLWSRNYNKIQFEYPIKKALQPLNEQLNTLQEKINLEDAKINSLTEELIELRGAREEKRRINAYLRMDIAELEEEMLPTYEEEESRKIKMIMDYRAE